MGHSDYIHIPYRLSVASESTIDAIRIPKPFPFNFQCPILSELDLFCNAAN